MFIHAKVRYTETVCVCTSVTNNKDIITIVNILGFKFGGSFQSFALELATSLYLEGLFPIVIWTCPKTWCKEVRRLAALSMLTCVYSS